MLSYGRGATVSRRIPPMVFFPQMPDDPLSSRILDGLQFEIVVLDDQGVVLFCNDRARRLIDAREAVGVNSGGRLYFVDRETERKFRSLLCRLSETIEDIGETLILRGNLDEPQRTVSIRVLDGQLRKDARYALVTFTALGSSPKMRIAQAMQSFGLTPAEQRLTQYLAEGGRLGDAAESFGVSRHTVRNQLRSVFDKVGVRRQAELTRLMLGNCGYGAVA